MSVVHSAILLPDIIYSVLEQLLVVDSVSAHDHDDHGNSLRDLKAASMTSKAFREAARSMLFRCSAVEFRNVDDVFELLCTPAKLARLIRNLRINPRGKSLSPHVQGRILADED